MKTPLPPAHIPGTTRAEPRDVVRLTWWFERGATFAATSSDNPGPIRVYYAAVATAFWPLLPVALGAQLVRTTRPWARYYLSQKRDAVIAVGVRDGAWYVEDHFSSRPGSGRGRDLRAMVLPVLCDAADACGVAIEAVALTDHLARTYIDEVPGLTDQGRAGFRGRLLRREPQTLPV